jgi:hypothetical protein
MSLLLLLPIVLFALIAMLLTVTGMYVGTYIRPVGPSGLHVEVTLVICPRGTRVLDSLGKGEALT